MRRGRNNLIVISLFILVFTLNGCSIGDTEVLLKLDSKHTEIFNINDESCVLSEAKVFLVNYQNIYANMYDIDLWEHDFGNNSLEKYVKDITISQLAQIKSMIFLAEQENITLSEEEKSKIKKAAKEYFSSLTSEELKYLEVNQSIIETLYEQYGLANKLYNHLTQDVNNEVSEDEARMMEALQIKVTDKKLAEEVHDRLEKGEDFLTLAASLGSDNEVEEVEIKIGRGEWPKEVEEMAFSLEKEEVASYIKTEKGYYFIKCINNYNKQLTEENKDVIMERKRKEAFDDVYEAFIKTLPSKFEQKVWDDVKLEKNNKITTSSFFETYRKNCKW